VGTPDEQNEHQGKRETDMRALSIAATLLMVASASHALDFGSAVVVYRETFTETSSLTPEVDAFSAGGMFGLSSPPGSAPVLTGSAAHVHLPVPSEFTSLGVGLVTDVFGTKVVGVRASYANITSGTPGDMSAYLTAILSPVIPANVHLALHGDPGNEFGIFALNFLAGPNIPILLPTDAVLGLLAGNAFEIDLFFDRTAETATASIEIDGFGSFQTATEMLPGLGAAEIDGLLTAGRLQHARAEPARHRHYVLRDLRRSAPTARTRPCRERRPGRSADGRGKARPRRSWPTATTLATSMS
jgi:hypothetical protein